MNIFGIIKRGYRLPQRSYEIWFLIPVIILCSTATLRILLMRESIWVLFFPILTLLIGIGGIFSVRAYNFKIVQQVVSEKRGTIIIWGIMQDYNMVRVPSPPRLAYDKRRTPRLSSASMPRIIWNNPGILSEMFFGRSVDISQGGLCFSTNEKVVENEDLLIYIDVRIMNSFERIKAQVRYCNMGQRNGAEFIFPAKTVNIL